LLRYPQSEYICVGPNLNFEAMIVARVVALVIVCIVVVIVVLFVFICACCIPEAISGTG
jgi:hypothetical protein